LGRLLPRGIVLMATVMLTGSAPPVAAQAPDTAKPKLLFRYDLEKPPLELEDGGAIVLRPNVEQPVYFYVSNPGPESLQNVVVKLVKVLADKTDQTLATADPLPVLKKDSPTRLKFGKAAPAIAKDKPIPWPELDGPPFRLEFRVEVGKTEAATIGFALKIIEPRAFLTASKAEYNVDEQRFSVWIEADKEKFFGPKAVVELVLSPEVIPGLVPKKTAGAYRQVIKKAGDKVQLMADKLLFKGSPPKHGRIYVTVDGYERAFIFNNSFTEGAPQALSGGARARIVAPRYAVPGDKCLVRLEVDDAPTAGGFVDFGFDRAGDGRFDVDKLAGFRQQHVFFAPEGPKGGMAFKTVVADWTRELDTAEVFGPRQLRVQLLEVNAKGGQGKQIDLVDEQARPEESLPQFAKASASPYAPLSFDTDDKAVLATITLDGTPPESIAFVGWPKQLERGKRLTLKATGLDEESKISKVTFFLGEPVDGKMPPKVVQAPGKEVVPGKVWEGELPFDTAKPGRFEVSVLFTNGAGLSAAETVVIELVDAPKKGKKDGTTVKGKVFQGELTPPDVAVSLVDDKGVVKGVAKTNKTGEYAIEGVPPGTYRVVAFRSADSTTGQTAFTVPEGKELIEGVDIQISR